MSDTTHPVTARVSMPDGALLAGCCRVPAGQPMSQEREFLKALESAMTWPIDAGLLHLHRADGERVLVGPRRR